MYHTEGSEIAFDFVTIETTRNEIHMNPFIKNSATRKIFNFSAESIFGTAPLTQKLRGKAIKNAKFIQAYGFKIEQISKHCNRLC